MFNGSWKYSSLHSYCFYAAQDVFPLVFYESETDFNCVSLCIGETNVPLDQFDRDLFSALLYF